jgi:6 kDa early secretory antigenic target
MTEIKVHYSNLNTAAQDIRDAARKIKQQLDDLETEVKRVASTWEGAAKEAYQQRQQVWDREANELQIHLEKIATQVSAANDGYQDADRRGARRAGG